MTVFVDNKFVNQSRHFVRPAAAFANKGVTIRLWCDCIHLSRAAIEAKVLNCLSITAIELPLPQVGELVKGQVVL